MVWRTVEGIKSFMKLVGLLDEISCQISPAENLNKKKKGFARALLSVRFLF